MNFDEELAKAAKEMDDAEDALAKLGFPEDQWMLIKGYVLAATDSLGVSPCHIALRG